ncbi:hypothetical protein G4B84_006957 [Aspergillus flavus NRRL3357]|nr:uncharacterized protein G4B84_006957 [Aspergillus flavus NRRL3357]QMW31576.1 hypothetical protein G4B84_006957 [Aspergillus flavus NRRL3357]QMW46625.1 hypothetical protein G4B11_010080 [Aspergillus flavus]
MSSNAPATGNSKPYTPEEKQLLRSLRQEHKSWINILEAYNQQVAIDRQRTRHALQNQWRVILREGAASQQELDARTHQNEIISWGLVRSLFVREQYHLEQISRLERSLISARRTTHSERGAYAYLRARFDELQQAYDALLAEYNRRKREVSGFVCQECSKAGQATVTAGEVIEAIE